MIIDDNTFSKFVGNALPHKQMEDVEKQLIADGEIHTAIKASVLDYEFRKNEADQLLGEEDKNIEKKSNVIDRIDEAFDSKEVNITKKSIIMNINFTKEEVLKIQELFEEFKNNENKDLPLNENLVEFYLNQRPGTSKEDAEKVVEGLTRGVKFFHEELTFALKNNGVDYVGKLRELGKDLSNEEKYEIYVNFLSILTVLNVQNYDEESAAQIENYQAVKSRYTVTGEITEELLEEVIGKVSDALRENTFCLTTTETIGTLFEKIQEESTLEECLSGSEEDYRIKLVNAMVTYVAYQKGEIASLAGQEITPEDIAVGAAAGIEQARTIERFRLGHITWEQALRILKFIGGVALWCTLAFLFFSATMSLTLITLGVWVNLLGTSTLAFILSCAISLCFAYQLARISTNTIDTIVEWSGSTFDQVVKYWQEKAWPSIKERAEQIAKWFKNKTDDNVIEEAAEGSPQVVVIPQS